MVTKVLEELNDYSQYIKFTYGYSAENIPFLDLKVGLKDGKITTELHVKPTLLTVTNIFIFHQLIRTILIVQQFLAKLCA